MSSKKISDMSPPQLGIGRRSKALRHFRRLVSIQSGSPFIHDISLTMSVLSPRLGLKT